MTNPYYTASGSPSPSSHGASAIMRSSLKNIENAFDKMPTLSGNSYKPVMVSSDESAVIVAETDTEKSQFISNLGITATIEKLNFCSGLTSDIQSQINTLGALVGGGGVTPSSGGVMVGNGSAWVVQSGSAVRQTLGLSIGSDVQAHSDNLTSLAGFSPGLGEFIVGDQSGGFGLEGAETARSSLGVAIGTDVQAYSPRLTTIAGLSPADGSIIIGNGANFTAESGEVARESLGISFMSSATDTDTLGGGKVLMSFQDVRTAHGFNCLSLSETHTYCSGFGYAALERNTSGINNSAFGVSSLGANVDGSNNNAVGRSALRLNVSGSGNTAIGEQAVSNIIDTDDNVGVGAWCADGTVGMIRGTYLGARVTATASAENEIVIGESAIGNGSNTTTIGRIGTSKTSVYGNIISAISINTEGFSGGGSGFTMHENLSPGTTPSESVSLTCDFLSIGNSTLNIMTDGTPITSVNPTNPNRTLALKVNGDVYYLAAKTTND